MRTRAEVRRLCPLLLAASLLGGCAISPGNGRSPAVYDFGLPSARNGGEGEWPRIALEVVAPPWFDALNVDYRLAYDDPLKQREYSGSRWAGAPGVLLAQRLRQRLGMATSSGNAAASCLLRFELQEFSQVFDAPTQSRGVLQGTASLIDARKQRIAGRDFLIEQPAASQDARGGVDALVAAGSTLSSQLADWLGALEKSKAMVPCQLTAPATAATRK
ncbi:MAG: membrane integrity-associated transporter subunit PqiC [Propionivibrio sp.]|jgi:cholesterol transport system auxiliary component|uniref:ABC-type transport auxiliary lipoprotein family protein n=1 Tax=Propionivibrio sp. TaxID=2212460 RepID=UPI001B7A1D42|nr:ABC-type transport auxiliary lipoprotein family protein [Propionivibrio sp.]MBP7203121.1 membrane integrity-associated transporter subunit PqiC [Propionivibrio sp.]